MYLWNVTWNMANLQAEYKPLALQLPHAHIFMTWGATRTRNKTVCTQGKVYAQFELEPRLVQIQIIITSHVPELETQAFEKLSLFVLLPLRLSIL
jgi:hypothetical protein